MNEWMNERTNEWTNEWTNERTNERMNEWMNISRAVFWSQSIPAEMWKHEEEKLLETKEKSEETQTGWKRFIFSVELNRIKSGGSRNENGWMWFLMFFNVKVSKTAYKAAHTHTHTHARTHTHSHTHTHTPTCSTSDRNNRSAPCWLFHIKVFPVGFVQIKTLQNQTSEASNQNQTFTELPPEVELCWNIIKGLKMCRSKWVFGLKRAQKVQSPWNRMRSKVKRDKNVEENITI